MKSIRDIAAALGGIPALGQACGVQYRLAYGYVDRDSLPSQYDLKVVAALKAVGSEITLQDIAEHRALKALGASSAEQDAAKRKPRPCVEQDTNGEAAA